MSSRSFAGFVLFVSALSLGYAATAAVRTDSFINASRHHPASTPLSSIEVYSLDSVTAVADVACHQLGLEIARLYTYAKTLPSGHERRAFETRIYHFEKRHHPLAAAYDAEIWSALRADVHAEWTAVQASQPKLVAAN